MIIHSPWEWTKAPPTLPYVSNGALPTIGQPPGGPPPGAPGEGGQQAGAGAYTNPGNAILEYEKDLYRRAIRSPRSATTGNTDLSKTEPSHIPFNLTAAGDHTVTMGAPGYRIAVYMAIIYNGGDQATIRLLDGTQDLMGPLTALGGGMGLFLPWSDHPYFVCQAGRPFVISLSAGTGTYECTGFIKYRMLEYWGT